MPLENAGGRPIIGVDETGRGSLFGPIITCAVAFPEGGIDPALLARLGDSKALTEKRRDEVAALLKNSVRYAFGAASAPLVDAKNPLKATMHAMRQAVVRLGLPEGYVAVDGPYLPSGLPHPGEAIVRGDSLVPEIMAASILAKVFRDRLVRRLAERHTDYGLARNAGYGTKAHFDAVKRLGPSPHHRLTFLKRVLMEATA